MQKRTQNVHNFFSTHLLIMEVDFGMVVCITKVAVLQDLRWIDHFVWDYIAVLNLSY